MPDRPVNEATALLKSYEQNDPSEGSTISESLREFSERVSRMVQSHVGSIGMLGSMSIAVNSLTGPAMVDLPATFARSGLIPTIFTICFVCVLSSLCSMHMASSISKVPGNGNFKKEVEYSEVFKFFWGQRWFYITQILFLCCITCLNISSIVDTAQVVDTFAGHWWPGGTAAVNFGGNNCYISDVDADLGSVRWVRWDYSICTEVELEEGLCLPFKSCKGVLITTGNLVVTILFFPLAMMDLKENSWWQIVAFFILLVTSLQFVIQFVSSGLEPERLSWWGQDWSDLLGVVLFNFALVIVVPAWLYEREPHVDIPTVVYGSSVLSAMLYIAIGVLGCLSMPNVSDNMLESMMSGTMGTALQLGASIFAFAIVGLGIPLFSVLTRLNLTGSGLCTHQQGNILAVYFPFIASLFLSDGAAVATLLGLGGTVFTSLIAFILPLMLALHVVNEIDTEGTVKVYIGLSPENDRKQTMLRILLMFAMLAISLALFGSLVGGKKPP